jgi:hypothetical protein
MIVICLQILTDGVESLCRLVQVGETAPDYDDSSGHGGDKCVGKELELEQCLRLVSACVFILPPEGLAAALRIADTGLAVAR